MIRAFFYREWIKSKIIILFITAIYLGVICYIFIDINKMFEINSAMSVWNLLLNNESSLVLNFKYIPLVAGILLGVSQFVPEIVDKRLKLSLHLPLKDTNILITLLTFGISILVILSIFTITSITLCLNHFLAKEFTIIAMQTLAPWILGGFVAYLLTSCIILEPSWKRRLIITVISYFTLEIFFTAMSFGAFRTAILPALILLAFMLVLPFNSTIRFKDGDEK